jgi:acetylserotonin N-methyltransferase
MEWLTLDKLPRKLLASLDIESVFKVSRCVIAAERLQLFRKLDGKELGAAEIGREVGLHENQREVFLDILTALGLLERRDGRYGVSALARKHFVQDRGPHWSRLWPRYCIDDYTALSVLEESLTTGRDYRRILKMTREAEYEVLQHDRRWAEDFTQIMHELGREAAETLAEKLDLSGYTALLDVGGGSGVMAMGLVRANPELRACVQDFAPVCEVARRIIAAEGLSDRVTTYAADMNEEIAAGYDVVMYWNVGAIRPESLRLAYESLPEGGMVLIEGTFGDRPNRSLNRLTRQLTLIYPDCSTRDETIANARRAGFRRVERERIEGLAWMVVGHKDQGVELPDRGMTAHGRSGHEADDSSARR